MTPNWVNVLIFGRLMSTLFNTSKIKINRIGFNIGQSCGHAVCLSYAAARRDELVETTSKLSLLFTMPGALHGSIAGRTCDAAPKPGWGLNGCMGYLQAACTHMSTDGRKARLGRVGKGTRTSPFPCRYGIRGRGESHQRWGVGEFGDTPQISGEGTTLP